MTMSNRFCATQNTCAQAVTGASFANTSSTCAMFNIAMMMDTAFEAVSIIISAIISICIRISSIIIKTQYRKADVWKSV